MRIGFVGCVKTKAAARARACDMYVSPLFRGRRQYVERTCDRWFILSALHGLLSPEEVLDPYDATLIGMSRDRKRDWARSVLSQIDSFGLASTGTVFEIHAGSDYRDYGLAGLWRGCRGAAGSPEPG